MTMPVHHAMRRMNDTCIRNSTEVQRGHARRDAVKPGPAAETKRCNARGNTIDLVAIPGARLGERRLGKKQEC